MVLEVCSCRSTGGFGPVADGHVALLNTLRHVNMLLLREGTGNGMRMWAERAHF